ncbi:MAG: XRE family transcriptional regulator [Bacteroides sp.]|nr:XRE family transcriptional regulator [Bacteroides sp.]
MEETINDRIEQIIAQQFNDNRASCARAIGLNDTNLGSYVGSRRSKPSADICARFVKYLNIDARWLLLGNADPVPSVTISQTGARSVATGQGNITNNYGDCAHLLEKIELMQKLIEEKDERISELKALIDIYKREKIN